jgi:putative transcriptional regulator
MTTTAKEEQYYHYTECGLDNVYLSNGYMFIDHPAGRDLRITDIDGLHEAIGSLLINHKKNLSGKELRFLRKEMLMSQAFLAKLLDVGEQTVHRWEKGKAEIPKPAEALIRLLYRENSKKGKRGSSDIRRVLEEMADLEDAIDGRQISAKPSNRGWEASAMKRAA